MSTVDSQEEKDRIANEMSITKESFELTEQEIDERLDELYWEMCRKEDVEIIAYQDESY